MKIGGFDWECSNLNANWGIILCGGFKEIGAGQKPEIISIADTKSFKKDPVDDKELCQRLAEKLSEYDVWVSWYGSRFDVPYLNTRLLFHGLDPLPPTPHIDGWRIARNHLKLHSNRLATVSEFFGLEQKTPIVSSTWVRALAGHKPSMKYITDHCYADVIVLEQAYLKIRSLAPQHPSFRLFNGERMCCPRCGSSKVHRRGEHVALTRVYQRYQCQAKGCGGWFRDDKPIRNTKGRTLA